MAISNNPDFYLNFQQFDDLRLQAREQSGEAAQTVAQQFEGLFVQQMLAAMRSASKVDSEQNSSYVEFYQEMHDKQLAQTMSKQGYLGVDPAEYAGWRSSSDARTDSAATGSATPAKQVYSRCCSRLEQRNAAAGCRYAGPPSGSRQ